MAVIKGNARQTTSGQIVSEGAEVYLKLLRNGSISFADFLLTMQLGGYCKVAASGLAVTTVQCAGPYDADGEDFGLNVPGSVGVMVYKVEVVVTALTDDQDIEVLFMVSDVAMAGVTGTAVTIKNKLAGAGGLAGGSSCTCYVAFDAGGGTDVSGGTKAYPFFRTYHEKGAAPAAANSEEGSEQRYSWVAPRDGPPAIVIGAGSVAGHVCKTTAATAHITVEWVELPSTFFS